MARYVVAFGACMHCDRHLAFRAQWNARWKNFNTFAFPFALILSATKMHCDASAAHWKYERNCVATIAMQILRTCAIEGQAVTCVASGVLLRCRLKAEHLKLIECIFVGYCTACHFHNSSAHKHGIGARETNAVASNEHLDRI